MKKAALFLIPLFLGVHVYLGVQSAKELSPTYDEPLHLAAGYVYLKTGNYQVNGYHHPPFAEMWAATPLLFLKPFIPMQHPAWIAQKWSPLDQYRFADMFLYRNRISADRLMVFGRYAQLVLSLLLGVFIGWVTLRLAGWAAALMAVGFYSFSPTFLAHGTIVSTDLAFAFFTFSFFSFLSWKKTVPNAIGAGLSLGLCFASKYLAVAVIPSFIIVFFLWQRSQRPSLKYAGVMGGVAAFVLALMYQFSSLPIFWEGLTAIFSRSQAGRASFFLGERGVDGWLSYFPTVFLLKSTLPEILSLFLFCGLLLRKKIKLSAALWVPPLVLFVLACFSKVQIGHRHILGVYPFLFLWIALAWNGLPGKARMGSVFCLLWSFLSVLQLQPHFISYFNELIGGSKNGYKYVTDSNVDWGQGLKSLAAALSAEDKEKGIYLCYFGVADPHFYGIRYINFNSDTIAGHADDSHDATLNPTTFVISATNLQSTYYANAEAFAWLKAYTPVKQVAHSLFIYDFKKHPDVLSRFKRR